MSKVPKYIIEPKPGVRDSIRKWEWIRKETLKEKIVGHTYRRYAGEPCGLCIEALRNEGCMEMCEVCRFPQGRGQVSARCMSGKREVSDVLWKRMRNEECKEKDRIRTLKYIDAMLKSLRSIKDG